MKRIEVLIAVDASAALASNDLQSNVYLIDTNKYMGSGNEGQAELKTACQDGQLICWRVVPISQDNEVSISGFTGQMIDDGVCTPEKQGIDGDIYWEGRVEARGTTGTQQYSAVLVIDGKSMTFDPYLDIKS
ncbi:alpha-pore-forming tripartite toxin MakABE regulator [Endozoicomonas atrinae]|uniref:alpha-pore-forming tripartite toxin MakABE regulator n=1 Tax=Endozoicomonas atrinae TaxID=1333660 RepID=UPI003B00D786